MGQSRGEFIETDGDGLAEIHRRLARVGRDGKETVAKGEIVAREAMFFGAEDEGDAPAAGKLVANDGSERWELDDRLLGPAGFECAGSEDKGCGGQCFSQCAPHFCALEQIFRANGRLGLVPVRFVRSDDGEVAEAEIRHGTGDRADVERIARGDEDDVDGVGPGGLGSDEFGRDGQANIVVGAMPIAKGEPRTRVV